MAAAVTILGAGMRRFICRSCIGEGSDEVDLTPDAAVIPMNARALSLDEIACFLDHALNADGEHAAFYAGEQNGIYLPSQRQTRRIGLALEAKGDLVRLTQTENLDAVFLHRPWGMTTEQRGQLKNEGIGVLAYHLAFDERLTTGFNPHLADAIGLSGLEVLGYRLGRPLGMIGDLAKDWTFADAVDRLQGVLSGLDQVVPLVIAVQSSLRLAVVGAMNDALLREAHARGAGIYVTGQWRKPAEAAVRETGIGVLLTGHQRMEEWGLRTLAGLLREGLPLDVVLL